MIFRPEEVHGASGMGKAVHPLGKWHRHIAHDSFGFGFYENAIPKFHLDRGTAIKAGSVDPDQLSRKKPANCQRLEASLTKPFFFAIDGDTILGRQVAEGGKAADIVSLRKEPHARNSF